MKGQKREGHKWEALRVGRKKGRGRREQSGKGKERRTNERERGTIGKDGNRGMKTRETKEEGKDRTGE